MTTADDFKVWAKDAGEDMRANLEHWGNDPDAGNEIAQHRSSRFHPPDEPDDERTDYSPDQPRDDKGRFADGGGSGGGASGAASGGASTHTSAAGEHFGSAISSMKAGESEKNPAKRAEHFAKAAESYGKAASITGDHREGARAQAAKANDKAAEAHREAAKHDPSKAKEHEAAAKEHEGRAEAQRTHKGEHEAPNKPSEEHAPTGEHEKTTGHGGGGGKNPIGGFIDFLNKPLEGKGGEGGGGEGGGGEGGKAKVTISGGEGGGLSAKLGGHHHDASEGWKLPEDRTDDWNEELHPRVPAGNPDGGQFGSGGGGGGGGGGSAYTGGGGAGAAGTSISSSLSSGGGGGGGGGGKTIGAGSISVSVGEHRLTTARVNAPKVLEQHNMPKEKLFSKDEPPPDQKRAQERSALAKVLVLKEAPAPDKHDLKKDGDFDHKTGAHKLGTDAERVLKQLTPEHFEALRKYSNRYDFAMKQVEGGADRDALAKGSEKFWTSNLAGRGIDVEKMNPTDRAAAFQQHFGHPSGQDFVQAAATAVEHTHDMFAKVAPTPGVVYRGMNNMDPATVDKILNSKTMTLDTMSSFSFNHDVGHDYATGAQASKAAGTSAGRTAKFGEDKVLPNGVQVVMRVTHRSGVNMMGASDFKKEQEVLLPKGAQFRLSNVTREGNFDAKNLNNNDPPMIVVHMEEI